MKTIDTFVYRLGDQVDAWSVALLRTLGGNVAAITLVAMGLAGPWLLNALWLGRREAALAQIAAAPADGE